MVVSLKLRSEDYGLARTMGLTEIVLITLTLVFAAAALVVFSPVVVVVAIGALVVVVVVVVVVVATVVVGLVPSLGVMTVDGTDKGLLASLLVAVTVKV